MGAALPLGAAGEGRGAARRARRGARPEWNPRGRRPSHGRSPRGTVGDHCRGRHVHVRGQGRRAAPGDRPRVRRGRGILALAGVGDRVARTGALPLTRRRGDRDRGTDRDEAGRHRREGRRPWPGRPRLERGAHPRRHAAAGAGVQPVPQVGQPGGQPHLPGRVPSRRGAERGQPHARPPRRGAPQRRVRRLGLLEPRAPRRDRAGRGPGGRGLRPVRQRGPRRRRPGLRPLRRCRRGARRLARKRGHRRGIRLPGRAQRRVESARGRRGVHHRRVRTGRGGRARARRRRGGIRAPERLARGQPTPVAYGHRLRAGLAPRREPGERHAPPGERHGLPAGERRSRLERESGRRLAAGVVRHADLPPDVQRPVGRPHERDLDAAATGARQGRGPHAPVVANGGNAARPGGGHRGPGRPGSQRRHRLRVGDGERPRERGRAPADLGALRRGPRLPRHEHPADPGRPRRPVAGGRRLGVDDTLRHERHLDAPLPRSGRDGGEPAALGARARHALVVLQRGRLRGVPGPHPERAVPRLPAGLDAHPRQPAARGGAAVGGRGGSLVAHERRGTAAARRWRFSTGSTTRSPTSPW